MEQYLYSIDLGSNISPNMFCSVSFNPVKKKTLRKIPTFHLISWCRNIVETQFPQSFGRITVRFHKISTSGNEVKLAYFMQWNIINQDSQEQYFRICLTWYNCLPNKPITAELKLLVLAKSIFLIMNSYSSASFKLD